MVVLYHRFRNASHFPCPPGPRGLPIIGNLLDHPGDYSWVTYRQWSRDYGELYLYSIEVDLNGFRCIGSDLIRLKTLGTNIVIVNSHNTATDLLDKRGAVYSSRPTFTMLNELYEPSP